MGHSEPGGPQGPPALFFRCFTLLLGVAGIVALMFGVLPAVRDHAGISTAVDEYRLRDIEAGAYYYTGVEQVRDAELIIRHMMESQAQGRQAARGRTQRTTP